MEIDKGLGFLEQEVRELGQELRMLGLQVVPSGRNERVLKKDYVRILSAYYLIKKFGSLDLVPQSLRFRFSYDTPQLAYQYTKLKVVDQEKIWTEPDTWLTEKIDGVRGTFVLLPLEGYKCFSREMDENEYIFYDYGLRVFNPVMGEITIPIAADVEIKLKNLEVAKYLEENGYEADTEHKAITILLMMKEGDFITVQEQFKDLFYFKIIDLYYFCSEGDLRKKSYKFREAIFDKAILIMQTMGIDISRPQMCKDPATKKAFHEGIMRAGGEGTIAVPTEAACVLTGSRKKDGWIKVKQSIFNVANEGYVLGDTLDVFTQYIILCTEGICTGLIESINVAIIDSNTGQEKPMGTITAIPLSLRDPNKIGFNTVLEIDNYKLNDDGMFEDGMLKLIRFDKQPSSCLM